MHSLASLGPGPCRAGPHVVTLHDVTFLLTPTFGAVTTRGMELLVARGGARARGG